MPAEPSTYNYGGADDPMNESRNLGLKSQKSFISVSKQEFFDIIGQSKQLLMELKELEENQIEADSDKPESSAGGGNKSRVEIESNFNLLDENDKEYA